VVEKNRLNLVVMFTILLIIFWSQWLVASRWVRSILDFVILLWLAGVIAALVIYLVWNFFVVTVHRRT